MTTKLTLSIEKSVIKRVKSYAKIPKEVCLKLLKII